MYCLRSRLEISLVCWHLQSPPKDKGNTCESTKFNTAIKTHLKSPNPCVSVLKKSVSLADLETDSSSVSLPHTSLPKHLNLDLRRKPRRVWVGFHAHSLWHLCWDCQQGGQLVPASEDRFFHRVEMTPVHRKWAETRQFPGCQWLRCHCSGYHPWLLHLRQARSSSDLLSKWDQMHFPFPPSSPFWFKIAVSCWRLNFRSDSYYSRSWGLTKDQKAHFAVQPSRSPTKKLHQGKRRWRERASALLIKQREIVTFPPHKT